MKIANLANVRKPGDSQDNSQLNQCQKRVCIDNAQWKRALRVAIYSTVVNLNVSNIPIYCCGEDRQRAC